MAINIDSYIDVKYSGVTVERIGLSAGMDTISNDDILDYIFCGSYNKIIHGVIPRKTDVPMTQYRQEIPFNFEMDDPRVEINIGGYDLNPNGMYMGVIWLYTDIFANHPENNGNLSHFKIVMDWDAPNYFATCPDPDGIRDNITSWSASDTSKCFATNGTYTALTYVFQNHNINVPDIYPYMVFKTTEGGDDLLFISCLRQNANTFRCRPYTRGTQIRFIGTTTLKSFRNNEQTYSPVGAKMATYGKTLPYKWYMGSSPGQASTNPNAYGTTEMQNLFFYTEGGSNSASTIGCMDWLWYLDTKDESLLFWASGGLKFKAGTKTYKPIITNGLVVGFSDDMSKPSDLDNWSGSTKHGIPINPPIPTPTDDNYTDMDLGVSNITLGGLTKYAILSKSELVGLIADFNGNASMAGSNFSNHIICLYRLGFPASLIATTSTGNIVMVRSAGDVDFTSQANTYRLVERQTAFIDAGGITVPRMTNTFYDFSPYTSYELYIPGCGWIPLPDNVAGRKIHVYIVFDLPTCSAKGIVRIAGGVYGGTTIATVNGIIGASCPFTIGENGQQRAAVMSANAQVAAGIATGIVGATVNPMMAVAGGAELLSGLIGAYTAGNTNYVSTKGGAADFSMFGDGGRAVLKINSPVVDSVVNNSDFGHTVGYMCNETGQLSNFHGFTVCSNPHIHISATSTEKEEIKRLLEEGVILP